jgi:hypothetical protein
MNAQQLKTWESEIEYLQEKNRQQQADKDRALRVLKEVDGVLLDYIEQLEKKPMTTLAHGRGVALAVKYMIAVLEEAQENG